MTAFLEYAINTIKNYPDLVITLAMLEAWGLPDEIVRSSQPLLRETNLA
jgi:hypothetical protein